MRSKEELLDLIYKDLHEVVQYYENKQERKKQGKQYKTDPFDGRRQNGGRRIGAGAKSESMKGNINACKTFLDFSLEKRYGVPKDSLLGIELLVELMSAAYLSLLKYYEFNEYIKAVDVWARINNRWIRTIEKHYNLN